MPGVTLNAETQRAPRRAEASSAFSLRARRLCVECPAVLLVALLLAALAPALPAQEEEESGARIAPAQVPASEKAKLAKLLPAPGGAGATAEEPRFYAADLYQYIDGAAEAFHMYDLVAMVHREYKAGGAEITVDIYDMGEPINAFGIYSAERSPENRYIQVGAEGYIDEHVLNFLQGSFYVKLSAFSDKGSAQPAMRSFAGEISKRIGGGAALPAVLAVFPASGRVARSEKYVKRAPLGHEFLAPACTADYRFAGKQSSLLISTSADAAQAKKKLELLRGYFAKGGKVADEPALPGAWRGSSSREGQAIFFARGRHTVVLLNPPAEPQTLLKEVISRIKD